ncbi:MmpS family transport accessory protein [Micromonospora sp. NPDC050397]|uniref:MmpS family transport accessory protein n=1 Tax=Micromonospora sp. NPDC050397 TaxID=3364279 RepID=UPI00384FE477
MTEPEPPQPPSQPVPDSEATPSSWTPPPSPWARPSSPHYRAGPVEPPADPDHHRAGPVEPPAHPGEQGAHPSHTRAAPLGTLPWPGPAEPVRRRAGTGLVALVAVVAALLCGGLGVTGALLVTRLGSDSPRSASTEPPSGQGGGPAVPSTTEPSAPDPSQFAGPRVSYQVVGDGPVQINYLEYPNFPRQVDALALPWQVEFAMPEPGVVTVLAIRASLEPGEITCRIVVDGEEVVRNTATGPYATATCAGLTLG